MINIVSFFHESVSICISSLTWLHIGQGCSSDATTIFSTPPTDSLFVAVVGNGDDVAVDLGHVQIQTSIVIGGFTRNFIDRLQRSGGRRLDHVR